jgi:hypothetical protein
MGRRVEENEGQGDAEKRGERGCSAVMETDGIPVLRRLPWRGRQ